MVSESILVSLLGVLVTLVGIFVSAKGDGTYAVNEVINDEVYDRNGWRVTSERFKNGVITY